MSVQDIVPMSNLPAVLAAAVTPSDTADLGFKTRGLYVGVGGDVNVDMTNGDTVLFKNASAGSILPISVRRVRIASTTATNLLALY